MEPGCVVKALYDFNSRLEGELLVRNGDLIQVVGPVDKHWTVGRLGGQQGKFPSAYVVQVQLPQLSPGEELFAASADYSSDVPGDLCFHNGALIVGVGAVDANWWRGRLAEGGPVGLFPLSHAWRLEEGAGHAAQPQEVDLWARACQDTTAQLDDELGLRAGQLLHVRRIVDHHWLWGECNGQRGKFPRSLVVLLPPDGDAGQAPVAAAATCPPPPPGATVGPPAPPEQRPPECGGLVPPYGRCRYPFRAQYPNELSLGVGELVTLVRHVDDEWTEGELAGCRGLFPTQYVDLIVDCPPAQEDGEGDPIGACFGRALFDFPGDVEGDLALSAGDVVVLLARVNAHWYRARSRDGRTGICPTSFVEEMVRPGTSEGLRSRFNSAPVGLELRHREEPLRRANTLSSAESAAFKREVASFHQLKPVTRPAPTRPPPAIPSTAPLPNRSAPPVPLASAEPPRPALEGSSSTTTSQAAAAAAASQDVEKRRKLRDHRQCVLTELLQTERDYMGALQMCAEVYLNDTARSKMQSLDIDAGTLFGNIDQVIAVSSQLLAALEEELLKPESAQLIGTCFVKLADELKEVYGHYCRNHDDVSGLWMKCMESPRAAQFLQAGVSRMQQETNCFDLPSVLIRPVQRILKYPLLINELDKSTEAGHPDKAMLAQAMAKMSDVATSINECKRRKDLVCKYRRDPSESTLSRRLAKLNLHSVLKKSSRFGVRLSSTLGLTSVEKDESFEQAEREFRVLEKALRLFLKNLTGFCDQVKLMVQVSLQVSEDLVQFYHERQVLPEVERYRAAQHTVCSQHWQHFSTAVERDVASVLKQLLQLFVGPSKLISKRQHKLLDYAASQSRLDKNRDCTRHKALAEEQQLAKNTYGALNAQLLDELPQLCRIAREVLQSAVQELLRARKLFIGRTTHELLALMELPMMLGAKGGGDVLEHFLIKHSLVLQSLAEQPSEGSSLFRALLLTQGNRPRGGGGGAGPPPEQQQQQQQGDMQRVFVRSSYPMERVYTAVEDYASADILDLNLHAGDIVGVLKQQDPMGNTQRWFVDNGAMKGFVAARFLRPLHPAAPLDPPPPYSATDPLLPCTADHRKGCALAEISPPRALRGTCQPPAPAAVLPSPAANVGHKPDSLPPAPTVLQVQVSQVPAVPGAAVTSGGTAQLPVVPTPPSEKAGVTSYNYTFVAAGAERHPYEEIPEEPSIGSPIQETSGPRYANLEFDPLAAAGDKRAEDGASPPVVNEYFYALYPFSASGPHQLSVAQGQVLLVIHQCDLHANPEWWLVQDRHGNRGYAPANYLRHYRL